MDREPIEESNHFMVTLSNYYVQIKFFGETGKAPPGKLFKTAAEDVHYSF